MEFAPTAAGFRLLWRRGSRSRARATRVHGSSARAGSGPTRPDDARFKAIFEEAAIGMALVDSEGRPVASNVALRQMLGYSEDELRAMPFTSFTHPHDVTADWSLFAELIEGRRDSYRMEKRYLRKDGSVLWGRLTASLVRGSRDAPEYAVGMVEDISESKRLDEALRASEERYRSLVQTVGGVVMCLSPDSRILELNDEAERLHGRRRDELLGESFLELLPASLRGQFADEIGEALAGTARRGLETPVPDRDGGERVLLWNLSPLAGGNGEPTGVLAIGWDVTPLKHAEEAPTASEEQRRQSEKLEAVGQLAGGIAHDFNNLLLAMHGFGELALGQLDRGEHDIRPEIEGMLTAAERAASLTGQLLAFSRRQVLNPEVVDLTDIVADTEKLLRRLIGEDIDVVSTYGVGLGCVKADRGQLSQVLLNLALNARDAMPEGGTLTIETASACFDKPEAIAQTVIPAGDYVRLTVTDSGCGIPPETLPHIFEPFFTTKGPGRGTGLGLATVYGIVKQSNGYVAVDSVPGGGATFSIYLPRVDETARRAAVTAAGQTPSGGSETILIVEDEAAVREVLRECLSEFGYDVLTTGNGSEALALLAQHEGPIHLILTDVVMPGMSGFELTHQLSQTGNKAKFLYVSGYSEEAILRHGSLEPGAALLTKPFTLESLTRTVRRLLDSTP